MRIVPKLTLLATFLFLGFSCKDKDEPLPKPTLLTVKQEASLSNFRRHIFLSDESGSAISAINFRGDIVFDMKPFTNYDGGPLAITIVYTYNVNDTIYVELNTYPDIEFKEWTFKKIQAKSVQSNPARSINLKPGPGAEKIINCRSVGTDYISFFTCENLKNGAVYSPSPISSNGILYVFELANEPFTYYRFFKDFKSGDTLLVAPHENFDVAPPISLGSNSNTSVWSKAIGIIENLDETKEFYSFHFSNIHPTFTSGDIWYPINAGFDKYYTQVLLESDTSIIDVEVLGPPITTFLPTNLIFPIEIMNDRSFRYTPTAQPPTFCGVQWEQKHQNTILRWNMFGEADPNRIYKLPLPDNYLKDTYRWIDPNEFKVSALHSFNFEKFESLKQYLEARFGPSIGGEGIDMIYVSGDQYCFTKKLK